MTKSGLAIACVALVAAGLVLSVGAPAFAQGRREPAAKTPAGFSYEVVDGRRVPRGKRITNPDGSWREEIRDGACVAIKEQNAAGEYRETRKCD